MRCNQLWDRVAVVVEQYSCKPKHSLSYDWWPLSQQRVANILISTRGLYWCEWVMQTLRKLSRDATSRINGFFLLDVLHFFKMRGPLAFFVVPVASALSFSHFLKPLSLSFCVNWVTVAAIGWLDLCGHVQLLIERGCVVRVELKKCECRSDCTP